MSGGSLNPLNVVKELGDAAASFVGSVGKGIGNVVTGIGKTVDNILKNPLPVIETVALTYVLGPAGAGYSSATAAAVASAAVSAANGGKMEDIALNAAVAYGGAQIGEAAGAGAASSAQVAEMTAAEQAMVKQVVTSSSASAATTALRGGDFNQILASGVTGGVNGYVRDALAAQGFTQVDNKLVANAVSSATNAILKGKSINDAIGQSIAATTISATLQGKLDQINKNNEVGTSLTDKFTSLKDKADEYFTNNVKSLQDAAQADYAAAKASMDTYNATRTAFDAAVDDYNANKSAYDSWSPATYDEEGKQTGGSTASQEDYAKAANDAAARANELAPKLTDLAAAVQTNADKYAGSLTQLEPYQAEYTNTYLAPLKEINSQLTDFNTQQESLAKDVGEYTVKYQDQLKLDAADLQKQIDDRAAADLAAQEAERQKALEAGDWKAAYALDKTGYDAKELGITDANWKENQEKLQDLYITQGGFTKDWQQVGTDKVHLYPDGTGIGINENGEAYKLNADQVAQMIWKGEVTTANSGYADRPVDTRGYYNELTGRYVYDPSGTLAAPLDDSSGTNLASMEGYKYDSEKRVWTTPSGETVDLGYLQSSGQSVLGSALTGAAPKTTTAAPPANTATTAKRLPTATTAGLQAAAQQTNAMGLLSLLGAMDGNDQQTQPQQTVAPEAQEFDWTAPLETNPFKQNPTTTTSGTTKMARGGSIDDLVALLKRG